MYSYGLLDNGTANFLKSYQKSIIPQYPHGFNYISQSDIQWWLKQLNAIGYGARIHTFGGGGVRELLNAINSAKLAGSEQNHTLTHVEFVDQDDLGRFRALMSA